MEKAKDFYEFYNLTKASKKIYLAHGNEYRTNISKTYRGTEKEIELKMNNK